MAGSVNKVILLGNPGANPELKYLPSGQAVCEIRLATSSTYKDKNDQKQERTEWHRVVAWGKTAENCGKYLQKGRQIYLEGRLQTRSWDDKDGNKRYTTEIVADQVVFLRDGGSHERGESGGESEAPRQQRSQGGGGGQRQAASNNPPPPDEFGGGGGEDDIPF